MISKLRSNLALWFLNIAEKLSPGTLTGVINRRSGALATEIAMGYLDQERILHCSMCQSRAQLRRHGAWLACVDHNAYIRDAFEKKQAEMVEAQRKDTVLAGGMP